MHANGAHYNFFRGRLQKDDCSGCEKSFGPRLNLFKSVENIADILSPVLASLVSLTLLAGMVPLDQS